MAWLEEVHKKTVTSFKVSWREGGRTSRSRSFRTMPEAEAFKVEMDARWPVRKSGPVAGGGGRTAGDQRARILGSVKIDQNGCWRWQRYIGRHGYGSMTGPRVNDKPTCVLSHRYSYQLFVGEIPDGLHLDHLCRVRDCVNPEHLEPVTLQENLRRSPLHGAHYWGQGRCSNNHDLSVVGTYKARKWRMCAQCSRDAQARNKARKASAALVAGGVL